MTTGGWATHFAIYKLQHIILLHWTRVSFHTSNFLSQFLAIGYSKNSDAQLKVTLRVVGYFPFLLLSMEERNYRYVSPAFLLNWYRELSDSSVLMKQTESLLATLSVGCCKWTKSDYWSVLTEYMCMHTRVYVSVYICIGTYTHVKARDQPQV